MSFDQFNQDQVLNLDYGDDGAQRQVAITMLDRLQTDIYDFVAQRDSIMKIADTVARAAALRQMVAPRERRAVPGAARLPRQEYGRRPRRSCCPTRTAGRAFALPWIRPARRVSSFSTRAVG